MTDLIVVAPGPLTTVQDLGRAGYADLGVPLSGAADRRALKLANRLVGNTEWAAGLEVTLGGLRLRARRQVLIAITGAPADARIDDVDRGHHNATVLPAGAELFVPSPRSGLRTYVAVRGGIDVAPVLGSRSTDLLSGLGPAPLRAGDELAVGDLTGPWPSATEAPWDVLDPHRPVPLYASAGPRINHLEDPAALYTGIWTVNPASDRVGVRLDGNQGLRHRSDVGEMRSEPVALGSIQIPPSGQPVIFLADHPTTGGYPVVGVLVADSIYAAAQLTPGREVRFVAD
ncbi:biotin-dependent carboxyltransferase family protein [Williamsia sp.]|uniref:5-oxoprolinase subunit C family protein n=1 Tax=Williamsia sp. TaxID=1872085 RepID=UPI002F952FDA